MAQDQRPEGDRLARQRPRPSAPEEFLDALGPVSLESPPDGRQRAVLQDPLGREVAGLLTSREIEIVRMVASGLRNKEIGARLSLSEGTVKVHLHHIYEKLKVDSRVALTLYAQSKALV